MAKLVDCVIQQHDLIIVMLAALIALGGIIAFFLLLSRADECAARRQSHWLQVAAVAGGLSIWAVHFVAMLGYRGAPMLSFDPVVTVLSAFVVVSGLWLSVTLHVDGGRWSGLAAGTVATIAVGAMHFVGMAAIRTTGEFIYDPIPILTAIGISITAMALAFHRFCETRGFRRIAEPALLMIAGVCALHFTSMSATSVAVDTSIPPSSLAQEGTSWLIGAIFVAACTVVVSTTVAVFVDRYLTDLKGFADATLQGLAVVRDGRIVEVNARFADLFQRSDAELVGVAVDSLLVAADALAASTPRTAAIEASPLIGDRGRSFEIAVSTIEFRGRPHQILALLDLTEKKANQRQIERLACYDALTDLPNRVLLRDRIDTAVARAVRSNESLAVLALDLDRFKAVNDLFGHAQGDRVLKAVASILSRSVRSADTVARLGGDEFIILQVGAAQPEGARSLAQRIFEAFRVEMNAALDPTAVGVSIGVALAPDDARDTDALLHAADIALYRAKSAGRGTVAFYDLAMDREVRERRQLEADLRRAVAHEELQLAYQPMIDAGGAIVGYEALLRWEHESLGDVPPAVLIPIAEETGVIIALGEWVLRQACRDAARWDPSLAVAVNVSPLQFRVADLAAQVMSALRDGGLAPSRLGLEITETAMMHDREKTIDTLRRLKAMGVKVIMDDFGTGYSSLSNLQSFPFDKIKIDRSFVGSMRQDNDARAIVRAIVGLGRSLNLPVVAEGVETEEQYRMILDEGCSEAQGFYCGEPGAAPHRAAEVRARA